MMVPMTVPAYDVDAVAFVERLAERLRSRGLRHPVAAAVAQAARGRHGGAADRWSQHTGLEPDRLAALEAGAVPFAELPDPVVGWLTAAQLLQLAALDREAADPARGS
jgi:hypothetical protein